MKAISLNKSALRKFRHFAIPVAFFCSGGIHSFGSITADIPTSFPPARYEQMAGKSPFALATPVTPVVQTPSFAVNLYLTGVAKIGNTDFVSIASRDQSQPRFSLSSDDPPNKDGISLVSVAWSDKPGQSRVVVKKGIEPATLEFDQAALNSPVPPQANSMVGARPPLPLPGQPIIPTQPQGARRIILPPPPTGGANPNVPQPNRQRIRTINANPGQ